MNRNPTLIYPLLQIYLFFFRWNDVKQDDMYRSGKSTFLFKENEIRSTIIYQWACIPISISFVVQLHRMLLIAVCRMFVYIGNAAVLNFITDMLQCRISGKEFHRMQSMINDRDFAWSSLLRGKRKSHGYHGRAILGLKNF